LRPGKPEVDVYAEKDHPSILQGLRRGRIFVTTGDRVDRRCKVLFSG
jgi:hypothetical protein